MKLKTCILFFFCLFCYEVSPAQRQDNLTPKVDIKTTSCNENNSELSTLNQYTERDDLIIIISHLGNDEKKTFGQRRLHNVKTFFNKGFTSASNRPLKSIIIAEGERVEGKGYLNFFVKGQLELRIFLNRDQDFRVPPCVIQSPEEKPCASDFEKLFYPCKAKR